MDFITQITPELAIRIGVQVLLLLSSAFFSGSETALFSLSRLDLEKLRTTRNKRSDKLHELLDEPRRLIISILCGNELVNIASAANMAGILLITVGSENTTMINIMIMVPLLLLMGEVTPKTVAVTFPVKFSVGLSARFLPHWMALITPLRAIVRAIADRITTFVVGEPTDQDNILHPDEFRTIVEDSAAGGVIEASERVLIDNMLKASETEIINIMTPRSRITYLSDQMLVTDIVKKFRKYRHPRVPLVRKRLDNILGFLHSEDLTRLILKKTDLSLVNIRDLLRPAHFVPPTKKVDEMFDYFQRHQTRAAIVLGEFGNVEGIVTMKDVLTFIFGEISGKMTGKEYYQEKDDNCFNVPGDMRLDDFNNLTNFMLEDQRMTTIGGVAFRLFERLPQVGESVYNEGLKFTVTKMAKLRIKSLEVKQAGFEDEQEPEEAASIAAEIDENEEQGSETDMMLEELAQAETDIDIEEQQAGLEEMDKEDLDAEEVDAIEENVEPNDLSESQLAPQEVEKGRTEPGSPEQDMGVEETEPTEASSPKEQTDAPSLDPDTQPIEATPPDGIVHELDDEPAGEPDDEPAGAAAVEPAGEPVDLPIPQPVAENRDSQDKTPTEDDGLELVRNRLGGEHGNLD